MKGDFSRLPRDPTRYAAVLMQQGRVTLDADWNEQAVGSLLALRQVVSDLVGWHGTPVADAPSGGFEVSVTKAAAVVGPGVYYVDGIRCAATSPTEIVLPTGDAWLVYLEVWDRTVSAVEDPALLDPALGGADTSVRIEVAFRVRAIPVDGAKSPPRGRKEFRRLLRRAGVLRARSKSPTLEVGHRATDDPKTNPPSTDYTGAESHLYRIEIHAGSRGGRPSFKWSRDNGSIAWRIVRTESDTVVVMKAPDTGRSPRPGDWVEIETELEADDDSRAFVEVVAVDAIGAELRVELSEAIVERTVADVTVLRLWDAPESEIVTDEWIEIEHDLRVRFGVGTFRSGDYWVIAARVGLGVIDWPDGSSYAPFGIERHYAPLAWIGGGGEVADMRRLFSPPSAG